MRAYRGIQRSVRDKAITLKRLADILPKLKKQKKDIVFTNGCFDLLHYGHAKYLEIAKSKGDILIVGVNSDSSVRIIKGDKRPIIGERDRLNLIASLESVDFAVIFNQPTPLEIIKKIRPDIIIKGADWAEDKIVGGNFVKSYGGRVLTIKLVKGLSTTNLIKKIVKAS
ncbi:MAG: D-glycero-beta-D-manno-heptose 1-phosphate adenylyltransferase [Candidatus Omnitrophica bacterium]|nr:D-glycero-beta-D-manno-heptose 1-phosphate adenylyltransferase [Candidatus Omnitrophota bacterium]MDD4981812.1 D-glycero-beta-D-manno-heptose 1-phosphate adenylyltransferase [Candidatus Omnitrophota bacterium]MDD5665130.1 D-glycero-beta-D-manno-heptose 1-phosphate adenylyltransferase [Candidatus Omnitrophota bacterium]